MRALTCRPSVGAFPSGASAEQVGAAAAGAFWERPSDFVRLSDSQSLVL